MAGLNYAQRDSPRRCGTAKLFHIDLNGQARAAVTTRTCDSAAGNVAGRVLGGGTRSRRAAYSGPVHFDYKPPLDRG